MTTEAVDTVVVGGGQAGIAMSEHLGRAGIPHLVLERARIAERWRSERWDALVANGPAWHDRFPGMAFPGISPDAFPTREQVVAYFDAYAERIGAPIRCGVDVTSVTRLADRPGFLVETSNGAIEARRVVAATGPFQRPLIPPLVPESAPVRQIHSNSYRNAAALPPGGVLVVGAGSSGSQIADDLRRAGRQVWLSVGPHNRPPRRYRGRDNVWWLGVLGKWEAVTPDAGAEHVTIAVSGARGGHTVDFRELAEQGITLVGLTAGYTDGTVTFAPDLADNIAAGDADYLALLDAADAYIEANGLDLTEEPEARMFGPEPDCVKNPVRALDLAQDGIGTIIWATGYALDFGWLRVDTFGPDGRPIHQRGVAKEPGIYFVGLPWLSRRGSSFIWGVWHDAKFITDQIAIQRGYQAYEPDRVGQPA